MALTSKSRIGDNLKPRAPHNSTSKGGELVGGGGQIDKGKSIWKKTRSRKRCEERGEDHQHTKASIGYQPLLEVGRGARKGT